MTRREAWLLVAFVLTFIFISAMGQPRAQGLTMRGWDISREVSVIDTGGTCIYLYHGYAYGGIAVLSKSQLPSGKGCQ